MQTSNKVFPNLIPCMGTFIMFEHVLTQSVIRFVDSLMILEAAALYNLSLIPTSDFKVVNSAKVGNLIQPNFVVAIN